MSEEVICKVCGEPNKEGSNFCSSCGASISGKTSDKKFQKDKKSGGVADSKKNLKGNAKKIKDPVVQPKPEKITSKKLIYLVAALVVVAAFILIASGIFDNPTVTTAPSSQSNQPANPHAGVDLSTLQQITDLEKTVASDPTNKETLLHLAHLLNDSGFKDKAIERYKAYLKLDPKNADVWVDMGVCYYDTKHNEEAVSAMEAALKIQPRHQIANLNLGIVSMAMGNAAKATAYWQKAVEIDPSNEIGQKAKELLNSH